MLCSNLSPISYTICRPYIVRVIGEIKIKGKINIEHQKFNPFYNTILAMPLKHCTIIYVLRIRWADTVLVYRFLYILFTYVYIFGV